MSSEDACNFKTFGSTWVLTGEIDNPTVLAMLGAIRTADPDKPVLFLIDSCGGLAHSTLGLIIELRRLKHLETRSIGFCASAAVHLLQAGKVRTAYPHAAFYMHPLQCEETVDGASVRSFAEQFRNDTDSWLSVLLKRTKRGRRFWNAFLTSEHHFPASEALSYGLIDRIVSNP